MNILVILGPTASGKTGLAVEAARNLGGEIISADSRQVYRGLDIGSGKDLGEYGETPYHLIDIVDPGYEFSLFNYLKRFSITFEDISSRGKLPILAGGTGLYLDAVLRGYEMVEAEENPQLRKELELLPINELRTRLEKIRPQQHNTTDLDDRHRLIRAIEIAEAQAYAEKEPLSLPQLSARIFGIHWPREILRQRITRRLKERLELGMIEEVENLHANGVSWETLDFYGLEYRYVSQYLQGQLNRNDLFQKLNSAIHKFAKRQDTWFRRMEKNGVDIHWLEGSETPAAELLAVLSREHQC